MRNPNFLILDEPTNDLDLFTLMMLEDFLMDFSGCLLLVSHDRSFMDNLVDHIFVFEDDGIVKDYHSTYTEYTKKKSLQERQQKLEAKKEDKTSVQKPKATSNKPTYKQKQEYDTLEKEISDLEKEKESLFAKLNAADVDVKDLTNWSNRIGEIIKLEEEKTNRWLELSEIM